MTTLHSRLSLVRERRDVSQPIRWNLYSTRSVAGVALLFYVAGGLAVSIVCFNMTFVIIITFELNLRYGAQW